MGVINFLALGENTIFPQDKKYVHFWIPLTK